jgi:ApaG protein
MNESQCDIQVQVATSYIDDQSEPESDRYVFAYTITIANSGDVAAKLISRHWIITDANGKVQEMALVSTPQSHPLRLRCPDY